MPARSANLHASRLYSGTLVTSRLHGVDAHTHAINSRAAVSARFPHECGKSRVWTSQQI
jgi:hypothetical protein